MTSSIKAGIVIFGCLTMCQIAICQVALPQSTQLVITDISPAANGNLQLTIWNNSNKVITAYAYSSTATFSSTATSGSKLISGSVLQDSALYAGIHPILPG